MSARPSAFVERLRRELVAKGLTLQPTCPWCGKQVPANAWGREACRACDSERAEASVYFQAQIDTTLANEPTPPSELMFDSEDAAKPFLPDDEVVIRESRKHV